GCLVVALRGPGGRGSVTACRSSGLAFERRAGLLGPCRGVAQKRRERCQVLEVGVPAAVLPGTRERRPVMTAVMIGIDPHKASHTAVVISGAEEPLGELRVRASAAQAGRLLAWAAAWPERTWAVEGAGGLGHLLAQQLLS